jgi:hypothetical protein
MQAKKLDVYFPLTLFFSFGRCYFHYVNKYGILFEVDYFISLVLMVMSLFFEPCFAKNLAKTLFFITTHKCLQIVSLILPLNSKQAGKKILQSIYLQHALGTCIMCNVLLHVSLDSKYRGMNHVVFI